MMSPRNSRSSGKNNQTALAQHTSTAAETTFTTVTATLPGGATGKPIKVISSGSVGGVVQFQFGSQSVYQMPIAPNNLPVEYVIPASAFPNKTGSVQVGIMCSGGVGTIICIVEFATD
jgi:hypothetical protein